MPSTSKKQHNFMAAVANNPKFAKKADVPQSSFMAAVAHNPAFAKKVGVSQSVGKDFNEADKGHKFKEGGAMKSDMKQDKAMVKKAVGMHDKQMHGGKKTDLAALKKGGMAKGCGYSKGGQLAKANGVAVRGKTKGKIC